MDPDERLLDDVLGRGQVAKEQNRETQQLLVMADEQAREVVDALLVDRVDSHRRNSWFHRTLPRLASEQNFPAVRRLPPRKGCAQAASFPGHTGLPGTLSAATVGSQRAPPHRAGCNDGTRDCTRSAHYTQ